jgi:hypothetical protein
MNLTQGSDLPLLRSLVSADWWDTTAERLRAGVVYPYPWYDASIIMVTKKPHANAGFDPWAFLIPFDIYVWITILALIVVSALAHMFITELDRKATPGDKLDVFGTTMIIAVACTREFKYTCRTNAALLLSCSVSFWGLLMVAAYIANLASSLVAHQHLPTLQFSTLKQAVAHDLKMCISGGTATDDLVSLSYPNANLVRTATDLDTYKGVQNGICNIAITTVGTWQTYEYDALANGDCNLKWIGGVFKLVEAGFALKADSGILCTSLLRDVMNLYLEQMSADGFVDAAWSQYGEKYGTVVCDETGGTVMQTKQMTMLNMGGIFLFHGILTTVSLLMAIVVWYRSGEKTNTAKNLAEDVGRTERTVASSDLVPLETLNMIPEGVLAVEGLRTEMNVRFEKLLALLDKKDGYGDKVEL